MKTNNKKKFPIIPFIAFLICIICLITILVFGKLRIYNDTLGIVVASIFIPAIIVVIIYRIID